MKRVWLGVGSGVALGLLLRPSRVLATDTFLALVAGREIAHGGLPRTDTLCVVTQGHTWTDQQWLAQLVMWGVDRLTGIKGTLLFFTAVIAVAFGVCAWHASKRGATSAAVLVSSGVGFAMGVPFFTPRPQMFSVLGFAALLLLFADDKPADKPMPRKFWWSIPILGLWANLHGVVIIGAGLVGLRAAVDVWQRRSFTAVPIAAVAVTTPFWTPYARALPAYLHVIGRLQSPARRLPIVEWNRVRWPTDTPFFAVFAVVAILLVVVHWKKLSRPPLFETLVLVGTGLACWQASRHIQWFGLALAAYGAPVFDALPPVSEGEVLKKAAAVVTRGAPWLAALAVGRLLVSSQAVLESDVPHAALPTLERLATEHPDWHLASDDRFADWVLWHIPALRGRVEADVRFELLDDAQAREMGRFLFPEADWEKLYPDARMVLVARKPHELLDKRAAAQPGAETVWKDDVGRLIVR